MHMIKMFAYVHRWKSSSEMHCVLVIKFCQESSQLVESPVFAVIVYLVLIKTASNCLITNNA